MYYREKKPNIENKLCCPACDPELGPTSEIRLENYKKLVGWVIPKEVTAEWGGNIRFLPPGSVKLCNAEGDEVTCQCGKPAETLEDLDEDMTNRVLEYLNNGKCNFYIGNKK